ncbi:hypothetical protein LOK49_LG07G02001 [Camellia lanceoleosa]|uniref:Uncharacterized protein n=1 Tax=Camellia lanceoleosa TaxID=1840588 RepID=A0ACC0H5A2_9ERIC|nr:hypothetical protein LOK49_LG07G02001 [Camellia lanceoleosa]
MIGIVVGGGGVDKIGGSSTGVFASKITQAKDGKPVTIELIDAKTKEPQDTPEVDAALIATGRGLFTKGLGLENINVVIQRGFVLVDERMQVPHLYCIDDANEKMILAYAASAQGISVVEQVSGKDHVLNHLSIPAACFTHLEISNGWTQRPYRKNQSKGLNKESGQLERKEADIKRNAALSMPKFAEACQEPDCRHQQQDLLNLLGATYSTILFLGASNAIDAIRCSSWREHLYRERAAGMYSELPYAFAQVAIETIYVAIQTFIYALILHLMIGYELTAIKFFYFYYFIFMCFTYFSMYGMMIVALTPNHQIAAIVMSFFFSFWNLSGFLIPRPLIPIMVEVVLLVFSGCLDNLWHFHISSG